MTDSSRRSPNITMEQIIGNVTAELHSSDGQFVQMGFTPPPSPSKCTWKQEIRKPCLFNASSVPTPEPVFLNQPAPNFSQQYGYIHPNMFHDVDPSMYAFRSQLPKQNLNDVYRPDGRFYNQNMSENAYTNRHENINLNGLDANCPNGNIVFSKPTQLIENVVGNWVPNTTGTYSPFGSTQMQNKTSNIFEMYPENESFGQFFDDLKLHFENNKSEEMNSGFSFNRDVKKPRAVAEVKPMRPSYSDVLTKSAPQVSIKKGKLDIPDAKLKKDNPKKNSKANKSQKLNGSQRLNPNSSEAKTEKIPGAKSSEKSVKNKSNPLNRKWASLDNVNESSSDMNEDEAKKKKSDDANRPSKNNLQKAKKADFEENDLDNCKPDILNITKASIRKTKLNSKQRNPEGLDKNGAAKRNQRTRKRDSHIPFGLIGQKVKQYMPGWWKMVVSLFLWLFNLISDICSLSMHLSHDIVCNFGKWVVLQWTSLSNVIVAVLSHMHFVTWIWKKFIKRSEKEEKSRSFSHPGLQHNIVMPTTGDEAMKRLLACKGKDPYSILGVTPTCTDDDIKKYYKRQAFLVHPDKNQQPGAEEAFKILVHAFDMICEPERRATYDRGVAESAQVEQAWSELTELLAQLQKKVEAAANTIRCSACGFRHKRIKMERPCYAARNCATCKIHHSAREGDIWAEGRCMGFRWHYFACMEGGIYDITEWAGCQKDSLKHLRPDSHHVQYRIALGKQSGQNRRHHSSAQNESPPDLENLLNSLYGNQDVSQSVKRKNKKFNK